MAPEQATDAPIDGRADLFSLGVVLFELFTGRHPWSGGSELEVFHVMAKQPPDDLRDLRPKIDPELAAVVTRLLEKNPAARFPSAERGPAAARRLARCARLQGRQRGGARALRPAQRDAPDALVRARGRRRVRVRGDARQIAADRRARADRSASPAAAPAHVADRAQRRHPVAVDAAPLPQDRRRIDRRERHRRQDRPAGAERGDAGLGRGDPHGRQTEPADQGIRSRPPTPRA